MTGWKHVGGFIEAPTGIAHQVCIAIDGDISQGAVDFIDDVVFDIDVFDVIFDSVAVDGVVVDGVVVDGVVVDGVVVDDVVVDSINLGYGVTVGLILDVEAVVRRCFNFRVN